MRLSAPNRTAAAHTISRLTHSGSGGSPSATPTAASTRVSVLAKRCAVANYRVDGSADRRRRLLLSDCVVDGWSAAAAGVALLLLESTSGAIRNTLFDPTAAVTGVLIFRARSATI